MKKLLLTLALLFFGLANAYDLETVVWLQERFVEGSGAQVITCPYPGMSNSLHEVYMHYANTEREVVNVCLALPSLSRVESLGDLQAGIDAMLDGSPLQPMVSGPWENYTTFHRYPLKFGGDFTVSVYWDADDPRLAFMFK